MNTIYVIIGSTRPGRIGASVGEWFIKAAKEAASSNIKLELVDLADWNLPLLDEPVPAMRSNAYTQEHTKRWSQKIGKADGFIFVSAEHNNSIPAALKNALDYLYSEWAGKPTAFVTYGWNAGRSARQHLADIASKLDMNVLDAHVVIQFHPGMFGPNHQVVNPDQTFGQYVADAKATIKDMTDKLS